MGNIHCEFCATNTHSNTSCPYQIKEKENKVTKIPYPYNRFDGQVFYKKKAK